ncbi:ABC-2 family transporter protein [Candidatus Gottesmanbacteria bacterium]|nr:ABC-2 family transporter protein [Candidatus Gottesmanbacteria bacterium]
MMRKYIAVSQNSFYDYLAYRLNFLLWRMRVILFMLINYFLWLAVMPNEGSIFGYSQKEILTYIMLTILINGIVLSTQTARVAEEINSGSLNGFLIRPINYFLYNVFRDLPDKCINTFFSFIELGILIFLLHPPLYIARDLGSIALFILAVICASILYFEINMILSFLGFWVNDVWAPRFLFFILVSFLAGNYFPLDIFPESIYKFLEFLPFSYLVYFPLKLFIGHGAGISVVKGFLILLFWVVALFGVMEYIWRKGLRIYTAVGQ